MVSVTMMCQQPQVRRPRLNGSVNHHGGSPTLVNLNEQKQPANQLDEMAHTHTYQLIRSLSQCSSAQVTRAAPEGSTGPAVDDPVWRTESVPKTTVESTRNGPHQSTSNFLTMNGISNFKPALACGSVQPLLQYVAVRCRMQASRTRAVKCAVQGPSSTGRICSTCYMDTYDGNLNPKP
jgi:hypothetical protein